MAELTVSIDGLRRNIARSFADVFRAIKDEVPNWDDDSEYSETRHAMINLRSMIGAAMCVYSTDPADLFSNMEDQIDVLLPRFEEITGGQ
jgi:hypothetical protein